MDYKSENKNCQNCKQDFIIEPDDFAFYEKMKVPAPTFCPECRTQRRLAWRNERTLYKRKCNAPGHNEDIISVYSSDKSFTVYDHDYWWSDKWDPADFGRDYDFSKSFFLQFRELIERVPLINLSVTNMVRCEYCNVSGRDKDCYLISASGENEHVMYSNRTVFSKDCSDLYISDNNELCYELVNCAHCYKAVFSFKCNECRNSAFLFDCSNCESCFGCSNLRNKFYYIFNQPYTKEEYLEKIKEFDMGSYEFIEKTKRKVTKILKGTIRRFAYILKSQNVTGDNIANAKNCKNSFDIVGPMEDCKHNHWGGANARDCFDCGPGVGFGVEQAYESFDSGINGSGLFFNSVVYGSMNVYYSINCHSSKNIFGCYGVRKGEYCILNKKYSKEEYMEIIPKIIKHMNEFPYIDKNGRVYKYGEFFPVEVSPFSYNETIAQDYIPITKENALENGFAWYDSKSRDYSITKKFDDLPDHIKDTPDSVVQEIVECAGSTALGCATAFRITPNELSFYRRMNLPLPHYCFNCRHASRLARRNPMKLWHRKCMKEGCTNEFETSYAPDRPEIVYCENCYQQEIY